MKLDENEESYSLADIKAVSNNSSENENSDWWIVIFLIFAFYGFDTNIKSDRENLIRKVNESNLNDKEKKEITNILLN